MDKTLHTMVGATDTIFFAAATMVPIAETMVFFTHTVVSIPNTVVSSSEKIFLTRKTMVPGAKRMVSGFDTTVFVSHTGMRILDTHYLQFGAHSITSSLLNAYGIPHPMHSGYLPSSVDSLRF